MSRKIKGVGGSVFFRNQTSKNPNGSKIPVFGAIENSASDSAVNFAVNGVYYKYKLNKLHIFCSYLLI